MKIKMNDKQLFNFDSLKLNQLNLQDVQNPQFPICFDKDTVIFSINNLLVDTLINTKTSLKITQLPFENIFLKVSFKINNLFVKGINLVDFHNINKKKWFIVPNIIRRSPKEDIEGMFKFDFENDIISQTESVFDKVYLTFSERKKIINFIISFLNLLESKEDIETFESLEILEVNNKQQYNFKNKKIIIRPNKQLQRYLNNYEQQRAKYSHKFIVRGHWRHYQNHKLWIKPYFKGQGIFIKKDYEVRK